MCDEVCGVVCDEVCGDVCGDVCGVVCAGGDAGEAKQVRMRYGRDLVELVGAGQFVMDLVEFFGGRWGMVEVKRWGGDMIGGGQGCKSAERG